MRRCKVDSVSTKKYSYECARDEHAPRRPLPIDPAPGGTEPSSLQSYSNSVMSCRLRHVQLREQNVKHPHRGGPTRGSTAARPRADAPADVPTPDQARDAASGAQWNGHGPARDGAAARGTRALPRAQLGAPADAGRA